MVYNGGKLESLPGAGAYKLTISDEVSALVLDFGSHTTRAGYAGEDTPRVVCPSYYGYIDEPSSSTNGNANGNGNGEGDANGSGMDVDSTPGAGAGGEEPKSKSKRKYYVGEDGVGIWRPNMEVGNFTTDGIGELQLYSDPKSTTRCERGWTNPVVTDPEAASQLLHHIIHDRLGVDPTEHPLMITEPAWNTSKARELLTEMAFEGEKVPALYFGSQGVLSA